jgi:hypothetical protein
MATATFRAPSTGVTNMQSTNTKPINLNEIARKIRALRTLSQMSNHSFNRTIGAMIDGLTLEEQVKVGELLMDTPNSTQEEGK